MRSSDDESVNQALGAIEKWSRRVGENLERALCPIYRDGPRHPQLVGSGVLVRFDELILLVSAAHVCDDVGTGSRYFGALGRLLPLPAFFVRSPLPESGSRDDDRVDIAFWVLDPTVSRKLPSADTVFPASLDLAEPSKVSSGAQFFVNGYPHSRQPRRLDESEYSAQSFAFITEERAPDEYVGAGLERSSQLLVHFDKDDVYRGRAKHTGPDLQGVSGGPIWRVTGGGGATPQRPLLTGIATSWRRQEPTGIIATRTRVWIQEVTRQLPQIIQTLRKAHGRRTG